MTLSFSIGGQGEGLYICAMISQTCNSVFAKSIEAYHRKDDVDATIQNPYPAPSFEHLLYAKNWIDTVQWHLEDIIRNPQIDPVKALSLKRRIDTSNQERTDMVEHIDSWFLQQYSDVTVQRDATINTESPAWAIDRLSILALKIFHMQLEATRNNADESHRQSAQKKLDVLLLQREDLSIAIDQLVNDITSGRKYMKVYKQMKMYNDETLNPVLYSLKKDPA